MQVDLEVSEDVVIVVQNGAIQTFGDKFLYYTIIGLAAIYVIGVSILSPGLVDQYDMDPTLYISMLILSPFVVFGLCVAYTITIKLFANNSNQFSHKSYLTFSYLWPVIIVLPDILEVFSIESPVQGILTPIIGIFLQFTFVGTFLLIQFFALRANQQIRYHTKFDKKSSTMSVSHTIPIPFWDKKDLKSYDIGDDPRYGISVSSGSFSPVSGFGVIPKSRLDNPRLKIGLLNIFLDKEKQKAISILNGVDKDRLFEISDQLEKELGIQYYDTDELRRNR